MKTEYEFNCEHAKELANLISTNPSLRVIVWIWSDGITDEYTSWAGNLDRPCLMEITSNGERYIDHSGDDFDDCLNFYGDEAYDYTDEEIEIKARQIPWEKVIAVNVSVV